MLDVECSVRGFPETYVQKLKVQHKDNKKLFEPKHCDISRTFAIHHYAGQVVYETSDFLGKNVIFIEVKFELMFFLSYFRHEP